MTASAASLALFLVAFFLLIATAPIRLACYLLSVPKQGWRRSFVYFFIGTAVLLAVFRLAPFLQIVLLVKGAISFAVYYVLGSVLFKTNGLKAVVIATIATLLYQVQYVVSGMEGLR